MKGWLLDTNVISELRKHNCNDAVRTWSDAQPPATLFLSRITIAEIRYGIERQADPVFRIQLETWLNNGLRAWFGERILDLNEDVILEWRRMVKRGKAIGYTFSQPDLFLAATAAVHELCLVTRNLNDFRQTGVMTFNPWNGERIAINTT